MIKDSLLPSRPRIDTLANRGLAIDHANEWFWAKDENGGTPYWSNGLTWRKMAAGVTEASGQIIAGPVQFTGTQFDVKAVGITATDVPGMSINVPASSRAVFLRARFSIQANTGTAANASLVTMQLLLTDAANTILDLAAETILQVGTTANVRQGQLIIECYLPAPVIAATYKLRAKTQAAVPANWTSALLLPGYGTAGVPDNFYAVAA